MKPRIRDFLLPFMPLAAVAATEGEASALQPLDEFTRSAHRANLDSQDARIVAEQRAREADTALGRLLPSVSAVVGYTRNQFEVTVSRPGGDGQIERAIISPLDQVDATFTLRVPLIDVGGWRRLGAAREAENSARLRIAATESDVDAEIARLYYTIVGTTWLRDATEKALQSAEKNLEVVDLRRQAERALETEVLRARAEVERARRGLADADRQLRSACRALRTASGLEPTPGVPGFSASTRPPALAAPAAIEAQALATPAVRAADAEVAAAEKTRAAAWAAFLPTLGATATERLTNATGFAGRNALYNVQLTATWNFDYTTVTQARVAESAAALAKTRAERARRMQVDLAADAADRVASESVRVEAAVAEERAASAVAAHYRDRLAAGTVAWHEVVQAERDAFAATASRIQAGADLEYARALLAAKTRAVGP